MDAWLYAGAWILVGGVVAIGVCLCAIRSNDRDYRK